jgi:DNA polymerase-3 subunit delta
VKLYDNEVSSWISTYIKQQGFDIEPSAALILSDFLGTDLSRIVNEMNKLFTVLPENRKKITTLDIEKNIGISRDYNTFELSNAISKREVMKTNKIVLHFTKNPKDYPFNLTIATLFSQFSKLLKLHALRRQNRDSRDIISALGINPFFMKDYDAAARNYNLIQTVKIISLLREYDMKSKGFNYVEADDGELLRELTSKIFNVDYIAFK